MITQDEQNRLSFEQSKAEWDAYQKDKAEFEAYQKEVAGGGAIRTGSAQRSVSPGAAVGSVVGGVAGGALTAQTGGWGALPGAVVGAAVGEFGQQVYDKATNSAYAPVDAAEGATRIAKEAAFSAIGEGAGRAITFVRPVAYAQPRALTAEQIRTRNFLDQHGIPYTPDQITGSPFHSFARSIADNGIFSERDMTQFARDQHAAIRRSAEDIANTMGQRVPPDVLGQQVLRTVRGEDQTITDTVIQPLYNRIEHDLRYQTQTVQVPTGRMIPSPGGVLGPNGQPMMIPEMVDQTVTQGGLLVDQRPVRQLFQAEVANLERTAALENRRDLLQSAHYQSMRRFINMPEEGQWADAHQVLKETRKSLRELDNPMNQATEVLQDRAVLTRAERALETQLETALQQSANPAHQTDLALWRQAQNAVRTKNERLRNDVVLRFTRAIDEHGGEQGMKQFVNNMTPDDAGRIMAATSSDPVLQASLRRAYLEDKIIKAGGMADAEAPFNAEKFRQVLFGRDEMNMRKSEVLLSPQHRQQLNNFTDAVARMQREETSGKFGSVFIRMKSSGALFSVPLALYGASQIGGGDVKEGVAELAGAASILIAPNVLARLLTNPRATEYMIQGLRYSATDHSQALRITRELMRLDQGFAQAVRTGLSMNEAVPGGGPITRTAETVKKGVMETIPSIFGNQGGEPIGMPVRSNNEQSSFSLGDLLSPSEAGAAELPKKKEWPSRLSEKNGKIYDGGVEISKGELEAMLERGAKKERDNIKAVEKAPAGLKQIMEQMRQLDIETSQETYRHGREILERLNKKK